MFVSGCVMCTIVCVCLLLCVVFVVCGGVSAGVFDVVCDVGGCDDVSGE